MFLNNIFILYFLFSHINVTNYTDFRTKNLRKLYVFYSQFKTYNIGYVLKLRNIVTKLEFNTLKI